MEHSYTIPSPRFLREEEKIILALLLKPFPHILTESLSVILVEDMNDGGMGSVRVFSCDQDNRVLGKYVAEAEYIDEDGVPVSIAINTDQTGRLYEADFFKADSSPLRRYPQPDQLNVKS